MEKLRENYRNLERFYAEDMNKMTHIINSLADNAQVFVASTIDNKIVGEVGDDIKIGDIVIDNGSSVEDQRGFIYKVEDIREEELTAWFRTEFSSVTQDDDTVICANYHKNGDSNDGKYYVMNTDVKSDLKQEDGIEVTVEENAGEYTIVDEVSGCTVNIKPGYGDTFVIYKKYAEIPTWLSVKVGTTDSVSFCDDAAQASRTKEVRFTRVVTGTTAYTTTEIVVNGVGVNWLSFKPGDLYFKTKDKINDADVSRIDFIPFVKKTKVVTVVDLSVLNDGSGGGGGHIYNEELDSLAEGTNEEIGALNTASGVRSHAEGSGTVASGQCSHAEGYLTKASGQYSHAEGSGTTANGLCSHAEGCRTSAATEYSHAEGYNTLASGQYSHAEGQITKATNNHTHAEGCNTTASGSYSHAEGSNTTASGMFSHSEGHGSKAYGKFSHAENSGTTASGLCSHAEGATTEASGEYSHAEGEKTVAGGSASHAEGSYTTASGYISHAEGENTKASSRTSHAEGGFTKASGEYSHAEGYETTASGYISHAEGGYTKASGEYSHAEGYNTQAISGTSGEHAEGSYNISHSNTVSSIGCGTYIGRKNAFEVLSDGGVYVQGIGGYTGQNDPNSLDVKSLQEYILSLEERIRQLGG